MSQPATPIHQPITATLHLNSHIWSLMSSCRAYTPTNHRPISIYGHTPKNSSSSHIAMPLLTTRQFSRHIQTILINAAPASSYQTTRRHYLIYLRRSAHPKPRVSVLLRHFLSTNIPIPHTPIPTYGKPWSHCPSLHRGSRGAIAYPHNPTIVHVGT